jgi:hypothetical protein
MVGKKLTILIQSKKNCKMCKLQICIITNICKAIFVTIGRICTRSWRRQQRVGQLGPAVEGLEDEGGAVARVLGHDLGSIS